VSEADRFVNKFIQALRENKIVRLPKGDCPHPTEETTADASVSEHTYKATICFSVGNLTQKSPSSILQEVLGLLLHEVTHMGGAEESEARIWQDEFLDYFTRRFGNVLADTITRQTLTTITQAYALMFRAQGFAQSDINDRHILPDVTAAVERISDLPDAGDELALELKINPPHPELIENYVRAVQVVAKRKQIGLEKTRQNYDDFRSIEPMNVVKLEKAQSRIKKNGLGKLLSIKTASEISERLQAFLLMRGSQPKICADPNYKSSLELYVAERSISSW
jgi:hypothetical protein